MSRNFRNTVKSIIFLLIFLVAFAALRLSSLWIWGFVTPVWAMCLILALSIGSAYVLCPIPFVLHWIMQKLYYGPLAAMDAAIDSASE